MLMNVKNWFKRAAPASKRVIVVRSTDMRLTDWTVDESLVRQAAATLNTPIVQAMLAVLRTESPANYGLPMGATHDDRIVHAAKAEGYGLALNNLEAMAKAQGKMVALESTFEPEHPVERVEAEFQHVRAPQPMPPELSSMPTASLP